MTWRQYAERVRRENDTGDNRDDRDKSPPIGPNDPIGPPLDPVRAMKLWRTSLASVDPRQPPAGFEPKRWAQICDDAGFILHGFAEQAARDGWSAGEMFGLLLGHDGWGGIVSRLRGSRSLVMTADRASW